MTPDAARSGRGHRLEPVRWGFLGAGYVASRALGPAVHAADGAQLYAAAARDPRRARALEPAGSAYGSYEQLLADPRVEAVYIALANDQHLPWVLAALAAGKHVLCEKPLGLDAGEVEQITAAALVAGLLAVEAAWHRWHPRTIRSAELVRAGAVGAPTQLSGAFCFGGVPVDNYRLDPLRGGGARLDVGCYLVSAAHLLLGDELSVEWARERREPGGVDLETTATLRAPGGARATLLASIDAAEHQALTLRGEQADLTWSAPALTSWREPASLLITGSRPQPGAEHPPEMTPVVERFEPVDAYQLMVEQVSRCVRDGGAPVVALAESLRVATTLDAVRAVSCNADVGSGEWTTR